MPHAQASDGSALFYDVLGSGAPLLLLAGQSNHHRWWDSVRDRFAARFTTVVMDWRGTGESDAPDTDTYSTRNFARDAVAVLDAAGVERAHVYGTSMGGRVAQWLAADHPGRVDRLVLGCTSPGAPHGVERGPAVRKALADPDPDLARAALLDLMYTPAYTATRPGPFHTLGDPAMPPHARRRHLRASARHDAWDALPRIAAPTLVVHGTDDDFNPAANAPLLAERIPGARLSLIPGGRHAYFEEFADTATPLVTTFLEGS
ncbi:MULTISPECIES: alpha/beta fold hydrolase [unclassified Streptomyces]|uniref:alpha/beta fold hydrolase n=1 Tax=unclassified Streptomyces TaxID=2593676 RepID=UPI000DB94020|nr:MULTISPECIES: alpha/beta fold hydrolase [unclassified Streptomyces]MYT73676.1 alpha/beta fold hydrolase [Streptomyces sp. SID8367]RAJ85215.1 pimeloyl-ACP methyl ester carboxylesterase [Streptomyces sp. PsTaAH-137]